MTSLKELYASNVNIMEYFREHSNNKSNTLKSIMVSYDLQAGSYIKFLEDDREFDNCYIDGKRVKLTSKKYSEIFTDFLAGLINEFEYDSVLEAGVGEATTFANVLPKLRNQNARFLGFDLAMSRIFRGNQYIDSKSVKNAELFVSDLNNIALPDNSTDIIYTVHAMEPNTDGAESILRELYRVAGKYIILYEPSYELGNEETKYNIDKHKYVKNLKGIVDKLGYRILRYELAPIGTYTNQPAVMIIEKEKTTSKAVSKNEYACPICHKALKSVGGNYYCEDCYSVYPVISNIPVLLRDNAVLFTQYMDC